MKRSLKLGGGGGIKWGIHCVQDFVIELQNSKFDLLCAGS
jgi:hypothetical protein